MIMQVYEILTEHLFDLPIDKGEHLFYNSKQ